MTNKNQIIIPLVSIMALLFVSSSHSTITAVLTRINDAVNTFINAQGNQSQIETGAFGEVVAGTDSAGLTTNIKRDFNGNPLSINSPTGEIIERAFDSRGNLISISDQTLNGTTTIEYETDFNKVTSLSDPFLAESTAKYDIKGNLTSVITAEGRTSNANFQQNGLLSSFTNSLGTVSTLDFNANQQPVLIVVGSDLEQRQTALTYTTEGYVDTDTDALGRVLDLDYDAMGRVSRLILPDTRQIELAYDPVGNLISFIPSGRNAYGFSYNNVGLLNAEQYPAVTGGGTNQISFAYNPGRQLSLITRADGVAINLTYDIAGRLQKVSQPNGNYTINYGANTGLIDSITSPYGIIQNHIYNNNLLIQLSWSGALSGSVGYGYDAKGRITNLTIAGQAISYAYNLDDDIIQAGQQTLSHDAISGLLTGTTLGTINENYSYNQFAELTRHTVTAGATALYDVQYSRDLLGRITQAVEVIQGDATTFDYSYDVAGRMSTVSENGTLANTYTYDTNDNRTDNGGTYDAQDRITEQTDINYTYNAQGERIKKNANSNITEYQYDAQGSLIGATLPTGEQVDYLLDGQSRRVVKQVNGATIDAWLYADTLNPVARLDNTNSITQRYIYSSRPNVPAYIDTGEIQYRIISDQLGSVRLVVDAGNGTVIQRIDYDAWGAITTDTNPNFQPFGFAGGLHDADTGLVHFGLREYDTQTAHWTRKDPIGFVGSENNLYAYVAADPLNLVDPTGTESTNVTGGQNTSIIGALLNAGLETCKVKEDEDSSVSDVLRSLQARELTIGNNVFAAEQISSSPSQELQLVSDESTTAARVGEKLPEYLLRRLAREDAMRERQGQLLQKELQILRKRQR